MQQNTSDNKMQHQVISYVKVNMTRGLLSIRLCLVYEMDERKNVFPGISSSYFKTKRNQWYLVIFNTLLIYSISRHAKWIHQRHHHKLFTAGVFLCRSPPSRIHTLCSFWVCASVLDYSSSTPATTGPEHALSSWLAAGCLHWTAQGLAGFNKFSLALISRPSWDQASEQIKKAY